jgi:cell division protein FtsZ
MMGTGEEQGEGRALMAAENAIQNPLLDEVTLKGAKAVLVNITGGLDMTLLEVDEAANAISAQVDTDANIIFGAAFDPTLKETLRVSVVATGMDGAAISAIEPAPRRVSSRRQEPEPVAIAPEPEPLPEPVAEPAPEPQPVLALEPEPAAPEFEPEPAMEAIEPPPAPFVQPKVFEPLRAAAYATPSAPRPPAIQPEMAAEPMVVAPQPRVVSKIVDPSVADEDDEPLFPPSHLADEPRQKSGWLSLFGRPRQETQRPALRPTGSAQPSVDPHAEEATQEDDDLEIPSFLRRLAN